MNVLLLGAKGQLGFELNRILPEFHWGTVHSLSRDELDVADLNAVEDCLNRLQPKIIVNACAYTAVDLAESQSELADTVNHRVPEILAKYANTSQSILVHYSTDFVFDGQKRSPYLEQDETFPLSVYGKSKLAGEKAILGSGCQHLIFRTGWLMSAHGQNFLKTMLRLAKEKPDIKVIVDQQGTPTSAKWLAQMSMRALQQCMDQMVAEQPPYWGLYHASSSGVTSWHAYAQEAIAFAQDLGAKHTLRPQDVLPIPTLDYPLPASRPPYSVLSNLKIIKTFGFQIPDWRDSVHEVIEEIETSNPPFVTPKK